MAISKLSIPQYVDGSSKIHAADLNAIISKVNELVDAANGSSSGGGGSSSGGNDTPTPPTQEPQYVMPVAFKNVDYANGTGNVIKDEGDYVLYSANYTNKKNISYLMTNYAISGYNSIEDAWWNIGVTANNHIYLKLEWNNNCADTITNCVIRLSYKKGFSSTVGSLEIPLPNGNHSELIDVADLLRSANATSYQNITHLAIHGIFSDTAEAAAAVDISVKVYGINNA